MKQKLTIDEQLRHLESKGIVFNICEKSKAEVFLQNNNYFFRIKSYTKNYDKNSYKKYINLDFAYLIEFSTLDLYLRRLILSYSLDIEHSLKLILLRHFDTNQKENGYEIVKSFLKQNPNVNDQISKKKTSASFIQNLLNKYSDIPLWTLIEILSFGDFLRFYKFYFKVYPDKYFYDTYHQMAFCVRILRNASAHNNCMLNTLRIPYNDNFKPNKQVQSYIKKLNLLSEDTHKHIFNSPLLHDCLVMLVLFNKICTSQAIKNARKKDLLSFFKRCKKHKNYFEKENYFTSRFQAMTKICLKLIEC
ncbi:Abi family protein [Campylobacter insulaenigrae]|uniref:Abi family protein n=1 Tax=Campylobacter insulaenigrae TaxID=260714 RepID=UPI002152EF69|nr:Abi family protein [Campylobacter insulaenigrae]MCR6572518.1 Abi family protein [Campylobacter insulaenigrae]MCR6575311.1 Abi family protein [Campylobacter insulaenigrae]MCR6576890.1 Abi family protein [Campylobacter insulaenigrae]MCR6581394.1 Abi family protein [Campylobacter insulaenigrae]MCR6587514.1 Abi family protein [Campylobacter insulaenigrae]